MTQETGVTVVKPVEAKDEVDLVPIELKKPYFNVYRSEGGFVALDHVSKEHADTCTDHTDGHERVMLIKVDLSDILVPRVSP